MRLAISAAPALVKVRHRMCSGRTPASSRRSTRAVSTWVLPVPADADSAAWTVGIGRQRLVALELGEGLEPVAHQRPASQARGRGHRKRAHERQDDDKTTDEADDARRAKLVKAGVAVGIGSAAIVAACSTRPRSRRPRKQNSAHSRPYHSSSRISWS